MKRRYAVLILALAGSPVCQAASAQQTQPVTSGGPAGVAAPSADPLNDPNCQRRFEATFGPEAFKVDQSATKADDADFAEKLSAAAAKADNDTGFQVYLYDKVCIFGLRLPKTCALVQQTLAKLDRLAPRQRRCWEEYRLELCRQLLRLAKPADRTSLGEDLIAELIIVADLRAEAGKWDEAADLYQQAVLTAVPMKSHQMYVAGERFNQTGRVREVLALRRRLEQKPNDAKLRVSVIDAYLGLLEDPAGAAELLNAEVGEAYRTYVPLATRFPEDLTSGLLMELGNWYKTLVRRAPAAVRPTLARRMKDYYLAHILKIRREGATVSAVQETVTKINAGLKEIGQDKLPERALFRDPVVQSSFDRAVKWLWNAQGPDGGWITHRMGDAYEYGAFNTFSTTAVLAALLGGGASVDDPRAVRALLWLAPTATRQTDGVAFRCLTWLEIQKQRPGQVAQMLTNDMTTLIRATRNGGYGETVTSWNHPSFDRSWQAPLGVDAGEQCGLKAQRTYWQQVAGYWAGQQRPDGSICLDGKGDARKKYGSPPTVIGAGSLAIALGRLYGPEAVKKPAGPCEPLARALAWLDKNFTLEDLRTQESLAREKAEAAGKPGPPADGPGPKHIILGDATYMLSHLGLATGRDKLAQVKWWTDGSRYLAGLQKSDGSWEGVIDTALASLFMINGYRFEQANSGTLPALLAGDAARPAATQDAGPKPRALDERDAGRLLQRKESLLTGRLKDNPGSRAAAEQLVRLYVLEFQEPQKALEYADRTGNFLVKRFIGLLGKDTSVLYTGELLGLADWHMDLADGAPDAGRKLALARAVDYYRNYLDRKPVMSANAFKARACLEEAREALSAMGGQ